jgi:hypothetical protein
MAQVVLATKAVAVAVAVEPLEVWALVLSVVMVEQV